MFLTTRQKAVVESQKPTMRYNMVPSERLGISDSTIHSINSEIFNNFTEALELMADHEVFEIFRGRFKKHKDDVWEHTRQIRSLLKEID